MQTVAIEGTVRENLGKKATKALRGEGLVPCVVYGGEEVIHFTAPAKAFKSLIYTPDFKLAEINAGSKKVTTILKDIQFHPVTDNILHVDFLQLVPNKTLIAEVPIKLVGTAPGVKLGGKLMQLLRRLKVKTTPESLVDAVEVSVDGLDLGKSVRVRDIPAVDGIQVMNATGIPVASIEIPRALRSAQAAEAAEEAKA